MKLSPNSLLHALKQTAIICTVVLFSAPSLLAEVKTPNVFGSHMVLQRDQPNRVWGRADANEKVTVKIADQTHEAQADKDGNWEVKLNPLAVGGPHELVIKGSNELKFEDVMVGEVWICSGQSNMQWSVNAAWDPDLESAAANYPNIRMINFPQVGTQEPIWSHDDRKWQVCTPQTVGSFSAVGYFFARQLHQTLNVPIGMINNAWGGSACEAWVNPERMKADERYKPLLERWEETVKAEAALAAKENPSEDDKKTLGNLRNQLRGNARPGNIYNGVLKSHLGYGIRGAIWYQGESNAGRAYQYRELFPLMITNWREEWKQGDFPFYWVQLADFMAENPNQFDSGWAELREAQTMTMDKLPNTGQAVIIDIGEGKDIHPKNKVDVGRRLARWALAKDYGINVPYKSPRYKSHEIKDGKVILKFDNIEQGWRPFDVNEPRGFAIAGEDKKWVWAKATIQKDGSIEVSAPEVSSPAAVRYGWADNPVCNMFSQNGLPLTPFRTDDWPGLTANNNR